MSFFKVEDEAQATALHQLNEVGIYDFWTEVSKTITHVECRIKRFICLSMLVLIFFVVLALAAATAFVVAVAVDFVVVLVPVVVHVVVDIQSHQYW